MADSIDVEVAYATPELQKILTLKVAVGTTALAAVQQSEIERFFPGLKPADMPLGIFGNALGARGMPVASEYQLKAGERVEIYRPLIADPKEVRKRRAAEAAERRRLEKESRKSGNAEPESAEPSPDSDSSSAQP